jgi:hypothetical protein
MGAENAVRSDSCIVSTGSNTQGKGIVIAGAIAYGKPIGDWNVIVLPRGRFGPELNGKRICRRRIEGGLICEGCVRAKTIGSGLVARGGKRTRLNKCDDVCAGPIRSRTEASSVQRCGGGDCRAGTS